MPRTKKLAGGPKEKKAMCMARKGRGPLKGLLTFVGKRRARGRTWKIKKKESEIMKGGDETGMNKY